MSISYATAFDVAEKLRESMQAHQRAKLFRASQRVADGKVVQGSRTQRNPDAQQEQWALAARLRMEAHALDPEHGAPAWADEQKQTNTAMDTHEALMAFYREKLGELPEPARPVKPVPLGVSGRRL